MTPEQIVAVLEKYEIRINTGALSIAPRRFEASRKAPPRSDATSIFHAEALFHALWMCEQTKTFAHTNPDKANRWLGFIQGVLWAEGIYSIDEMREDNR
jgi:hypothetical protein